MSSAQLEVTTVRGASAPQIVSDTYKNELPGPIGTNLYARFRNFLNEDAAGEIYSYLLTRQLYERNELGEITKQWRGERELGDSYFGRLLARDPEQPCEAFTQCCEMFEHPWFLSFLSAVAGEPIEFRRPATPYMMREGDRICLHDDMSDPTHRVSVVLGFTRDWKKEFGGNTVVGRVLRKTPLPTPDYIPFQLHRWQLTPTRATLIPAYNSLTILPLSEGLAHGVTTLRVDNPRLAMVSIYGSAELPFD